MPSFLLDVNQVRAYAKTKVQVTVQLHKSPSTYLDIHAYYRHPTERFDLRLTVEELDFYVVFTDFVLRPAPSVQLYELVLSFTTEELFRFANVRRRRTTSTRFTTRIEFQQRFKLNRGKYRYGDVFSNYPPPLFSSPRYPIYSICFFCLYRATGA